MLPLIGVVIVVIGFILRLDTIAVVLVAGVVTGLSGGLSIMEILHIVGKTFVETRYMSLFLLVLPVVGVLERYGLKEKSVSLIRSIKSATAGRVLILYHLVRELAAALSLRLGGHVQFIRPLVHPMAHGAAKKSCEKMDQEMEDDIKGCAAMSENLGNFFGQNVFVAAGGVLLIVATLKEQGIEVRPIDVAKASIPIALFAFFYGVVRYYLLDRKMKKKLSKEARGKSK